MARKAAQDAAQKKAAKQKKILILLALPALAALVYAYMTVTSLGKKPVAATPAAATTPASSIPTAGATAAPVTPGIEPAPVDSLNSFVALGSKDPFYDHGPNPNAASSTPGKGNSGKKGSGNKGGGGKGSSSKQPAAPLTGAVISINGKKLALAIGATFGQAPGLSGVSLFRLAHVTRTTADIDVVGTQQHFTLHVRQPLTLQQSGGWKYTLILEPVGSAAPMTIIQPSNGPGS